MSDKGRKDKLRERLREARHYFFLNPYIDSAFTRCPKCGGKTRVRKYCLVIHIEPRGLFSLNKSTKYCPGCDLIIVKQSELEKLLVKICEQCTPDIIGNEYFVFGTMDRKDWRKGQAGEMSYQESIKCTYPFKDVWKFQRKGWRFEK